MLPALGRKLTTRAKEPPDTVEPGSVQHAVPLHFDYVASSDMGRLRTNNEDAVRSVPERGMLVLADGMGGHNAGEVASGMAVNLISEQLSAWMQENPGASLRELRRAMAICVDNANRAIFEAANTRNECRGMGTTLVMAIVYHGEVVLGHAGDSRAYRWRGGKLQQLTRDHSLLQEQIDSGLLTSEEAALSGNHNLVTRALGVEDIVLLDVQCRSLADGDMYLLCSDGLTDMLTDGEVATVMAEAAHDAQLCARRLIEEANTHGGRDNVSVALLRVSAQEMQGAGSGQAQSLLQK